MFDVVLVRWVESGAEGAPLESSFEGIFWRWRCVGWFSVSRRE